MRSTLRQLKLGAKMSDKDAAIVCFEIDKNAEFLNTISQEIWKNPELRLEEVFAHNTLTKALREIGFEVQENYILPTAFKAEFSSKTKGGPVIAVLLEYDALPGLGHACGHNLIAEAGLAAAIAIKAVMEADPSIKGKLILLGTPAEEGEGGKIRLLNAKAFDGVAAALMVHPANFNAAFPHVLSRVQATVDFVGKESHASAFPWEGRNALDAAVASYQNLSLLRQHIKPSCRIHAIITNGGTRTNIIPAHTSMELGLRATTIGELDRLRSRAESCVTSAATATGCTANIRYDKDNTYENLITNNVIASLYEEYANKLGVTHVDRAKSSELPAGSTDMGNVSHEVPAIHPFYNINTKAFNHTKEFTEAAGSQRAQEPTLTAAKAMALTALKLMRCPKTLAEVKNQFERDVLEDKQ